MGYNPVSNDGFQRLVREHEEGLRGLRESSMASGTQSFQAINKLKKELLAIEEVLRRIPTSDGVSVQSLGVDFSDYTTGWRTFLRAEVPVGANMARAVLKVDSSLTNVAFEGDKDLTIPIGDIDAVKLRAVVEGKPQREVIGVVQYRSWSPFFNIYDSLTAEVVCSEGKNIVVELQALLRYPQFCHKPDGRDWLANRGNLSVLANFSAV